MLKEIDSIYKIGFLKQKCFRSIQNLSSDKFSPTLRSLNEINNRNKTKFFSLGLSSVKWNSFFHEKNLRMRGDSPTGLNMNSTVRMNLQQPFTSLILCNCSTHVYNIKYSIFIHGNKIPILTEYKWILHSNPSMK